MASRGGGHPSRGAGPPGGGRGNGNAGGRGWEGGHGGRGWNSGNNGGRGSNFVQGGPSGTAGSGSGGNSGHDTENHDNIFADGVFRAAPGRPNNGAGGYRNNQGFNRYNERRNFGGNGGNFWYNERRYTGYPNGRNVNPRQNDTADGLTVIQRQLVKEAAEALARQFVERQPDPVRSSDAPMQSAESQPMGPVAHAQPAVQMLQGRDYQLVLTSASLVRTGDAEGKIDETLGIEVFLPPKHSVEGILELYHENYNIALVRLKHDLTTAISPQDIFNVRESTENKSVVAIGRGPKRSHGLLMASMGEAKGKYKTEHKNKRSTGLAKKLYCPDLLISTCQIKKVGIGGPLIDLDGSFIGMNFYEESETTPFLPRKTIVTVLHKGFDLLERAAEPMDKVSGCGEESSSSSSAMESFVKNLQYNTRCFACTGLLITGKDCPLVLTSASLLRTDDAEGEIDEKLKIDLLGKLWGWDKLLPMGGSVSWSHYSAYLEEYLRRNADAVSSIAGLAQTCLNSEEELVSECKIQMKSETLLMRKSIVLSCLIRERVNSFIRTGCSHSHVSGAALLIAKNSHMGAALAKSCLKMEEELMYEWKTLVKRSMNDTLPISTIIQISLIKELALSVCSSGGELFAPFGVAFVYHLDEPTMAEKLVALNLLPELDGETTSAKEEQSTVMVVTPTAGSAHVLLR
ncbi:hypothetical protein ACQ4PT_047621 [Festuca glaucescens]